MSIALLFSGQGAQQVGMGADLYENSASARAIYDQADEILGWSLKHVSFEGPEDELTQTRVCQPALFVLGYALADALKERKVLNGELSAALGLSLGELTALAVAEVFDFATGLRIVAERSKLMQEACKQNDGTMASLIGGDIDEVKRLCLDFDIDMANLNCPGQVVVSGERAKIKAAIEAAREGSFRMVMPLKVAGAYHSRLMKTASDAFARFLEDIPFRPPVVKVFSNTDSKPHEEPGDIKDSLVRQIVSPVLWEECMRNAVASGVSQFYECGPGKILSGLARRTDRTWPVLSLGDFSDLPLSYAGNNR